VPTFPVGIVITMDEKDARTDQRQVRQFNIERLFEIKIAKKDCVCWTMMADRISNRPKLPCGSPKKATLSACFVLTQSLAT
jgi:hypothetical protein